MFYFWFDDIENLLVYLDAFILLCIFYFRKIVYFEEAKCFVLKYFSEYCNILVQLLIYDFFVFLCLIVSVSWLFSLFVLFGVGISIVRNYWINMTKRRSIETFSETSSVGLLPGTPQNLQRWYVHTVYILDDDTSKSLSCVYMGCEPDALWTSGPQKHSYTDHWNPSSCQLPSRSQRKIGLYRIGQDK